MSRGSAAKLAGVAYLGYIVFTVPNTILYTRATAGNDITQQLFSLAHMMPAVRVTVLLDLLQIVCALTLAATLYRLTEMVDPTLALIAMLFRVGEGLLISLPLLSKLEMMSLATSPVIPATDALSYKVLGNYISSRPDDQFSEFFFVVGGLLFAYLFLKGRLIPRWLAWIGVATIGMQAICVPLHMATLISGSSVSRLWMAIMFYEVPLGFWLIFKGVETSSVERMPLR